MKNIQCSLRCKKMKNSEHEKSPCHPLCTYVYVCNI
jgi:hypothetical protein